MINTFGDLVRCKREEKEMSLNAVAKESKLDVAYISKIEKNITKQPSYTSVAKISSVLSITTEELSQVFGVGVIKGSEFTIEDRNIERKMVLSQLNKIIIENSDSLNEKTIDTTIQVLKELKRLSSTNNEDVYYIFINDDKNKVIIKLNKCTVEIRRFIQRVFKENLIAVVEAKSMKLTDIQIVGFEYILYYAQSCGNVSIDEIIKFREYMEKNK